MADRLTINGRDFSATELSALGLNDELIEYFLQIKDQVSSTSLEITAIDNRLVDAEGNIVENTEAIVVTNENLAATNDALAETNQQIEAAQGEISNLDEAVTQTNTALIQTNLAVTQNANAIGDDTTGLTGRVVDLEALNRIGAAQANTNPIPAAATSALEIRDSNNAIIGYVPLFSAQW
ncbi:hypothetical protein PODOV084v1_p0050 [Vibrio phage 340E47.2]|nr:hypothetical protein PODOV084v1_p0050 [Vibrio phage 340E47.2]QZI91956.1 hypothetical protein PODOV077v1_p0045 [Vibrio phage 5P1a]